MDKPKARVKITLKCNKSCEYCINKCPEYRDRWHVITTITAVRWEKYRSIILSGGEPTLYTGLRDVARSLRIFTDGLVPIYLQTNGAKLTKKLVKDMDDDIDGIGLSIHDIGEFRHMLPRWLDILGVKPIRLYVEDSYFNNHSSFLIDVERMGFSFRKWHAGESDPTEEIYLLRS